MLSFDKIFVGSKRIWRGILFSLFCRSFAEISVPKYPWLLPTFLWLILPFNKITVTLTQIWRNILSFGYFDGGWSTLRCTLQYTLQNPPKNTPLDTPTYTQMHTSIHTSMHTPMHTPKHSNGHSYAQSYVQLNAPQLYCSLQFVRKCTLNCPLRRTLAPIYTAMHDPTHTIVHTAMCSPRHTSIRFQCTL